MSGIIQNPNSVYLNPGTLQGPNTTQPVPNFGATTTTTTAGGAPALPPQPGPQPGDIDPATGNRWTGSQWLPPNFFSDLNPGYNNTDAGNPGVNLPSTVNALANPAPTPGGNIPVVPTGAQGGNFFEIPDQYLQYFPANVIPQLQNYLRGIGYTGTGNVGQFGERTWSRPGGQGQFDFSFDDLMRMVNDSSARNWIQWFFGERGLPGWQRQQYPGQPPTAGQ